MLRTAVVPDVGSVRLVERVVDAAGRPVRLGAGEALASVTSAQHAIGRSFLIAGALALALILAASYLAGLSVSRPLRRMARVAERVDGGDLHPRMKADPASHEILVLAKAFNHMLDRLAAAFRQQRDFVADASHELRTPLAVIAGQLDVLARYEEPSADDVAHVQRIVAGEVARTTRLVEDMLLLARSEQREFVSRRPVDLPQFVEELWTSSTVGLNRRLELGPSPRGRSTPTRTVSPRRCATSSTTRSRTPSPTVMSRCTPRRWPVAACASPSPMTGRASRPTSGPASSSASIAPTRRAIAGPVAPGSVWPSCRPSPRRTTAAVRAAEPDGAGARIELEIDGFSPAQRHRPAEPVGVVRGTPPTGP